MLNQKFIILIISLFFLASCETATQDAVKGAAGKAGSAKAAKAGSASIFGSAKQTPADKLIAVGDRVLFDYDSSELSAELLTASCVAVSHDTKKNNDIIEIMTF